jgi:hypothetical protein
MIKKIINNNMILIHFSIKNLIFQITKYLQNRMMLKQNIIK